MTTNQQASTGTSLVKTPTPGAIEKWSLADDQIQLLKNTVCRGATDDEFGLFMTVANRMGLDPFIRQIHAVQRWDPKLERNVMSIQVGIDGYRLMAERSGVYAGQEGPLWCGQDGAWRDVWLESAAPMAAKVLVWRTDKKLPFVAIALWTSYVQTVKHKDGSFGVNAMWSKHGPGQLAKCAEALAFRKAFPVEIGGAAHVDEEMDFIEEKAVESKPQFVAPPPPQGPPPGVPITGSAVFDQKPNGDLQPRMVIVTETGTKPKAGRPPKAQPSQTPGTDPFRAAREAVDAREAQAKENLAVEIKKVEQIQDAVIAAGLAERDKWGQPVGPTSSGGTSDPAPSAASISDAPSTASTDTPSSDTGDATGGGHDFDDSPDSTPPTDEAAKLSDFHAFLAGCKNQREQSQGYDHWSGWVGEMGKTDPMWAKKTGAKWRLFVDAWSKRKAELPA